MNLKDKILNSPLVKESIFLERFDCEIWVYELTGYDRDQLAARFADSEIPASTRFNNLRASVAVASCRDADGNPIFTIDDIPALTLKSGAELDLIFDLARKISKMDEEDIEDMVKNSEGGPIESSGFDSPPNSEQQ